MRKDKQVIRNLLTNKSRERTTDLKLFDIVFVKGFYVNIMSEACLLEAEVWFYDLDCLLKYKDKGLSIKIIKLTHKYNLIFIKLKSLSTYLSILSIIFISVIGILISLIIKQLIKYSFWWLCDCLKL